MILFLDKSNWRGLLNINFYLIKQHVSGWNESFFIERKLQNFFVPKKVKVKSMEHYKGFSFSPTNLTSRCAKSAPQPHSTGATWRRSKCPEIISSIPLQALSMTLVQLYLGALVAQLACTCVSCEGKVKTTRNRKTDQQRIPATNLKMPLTNQQNKTSVTSHAITKTSTKHMEGKGKERTGGQKKRNIQSAFEDMPSSAAIHITLQNNPAQRMKHASINHASMTHLGTPKIHSTAFNLSIWLELL